MTTAPAPRDPTLRTRSDDGRGWRRLVRENWYRDVWLVLTTITVLLALIRAQQALDRDAESRRTAVELTCAAVSGVADGGRYVIERFVPDGRVRDEVVAEYRERIAAPVAERSGRRDLVRPDGTIDCPRVRAVVARGGSR